jgi:SAM-dependent methyltransferase
LPGADETIGALYRAMLLREPEVGALAHWRAPLEKLGIEHVVGEFLRSSEFADKIDRFISLYPYDLAAAQEIETEIGSQFLAQLWDRVAQTWTKLGDDQPYFSVLTDPQWLGLTEQGRVEAFYATGESDLRRLEAWLARNRVTVDPGGVCIEYGCGVGRCTEWLAQVFREIVALDVSPSHLELARRRAQDRKLLARVRHARIVGPADLTQLNGAGFFYSVIVLQHNPPPIIAAILDAAFAGLKPGGVAYFQVPTRGGEGYVFRAQDYLSHSGGGEMEMHAIAQQTVFGVAQRHGVRPIEVSADHYTGRLGVSTTFLMRKD